MKKQDIQRIERSKFDGPSLVDIVDAQGKKLREEYIMFDRTMKVFLQNGQECFVPDDPRNRHYQEVQAWLRDGNSIEEVEPAKGSN